MNKEQRMFEEKFSSMMNEAVDLVKMEDAWIKLNKMVQVGKKSASSNDKKHYEKMHKSLATFAEHLDQLE